MRYFYFTAPCATKNEPRTAEEQSELRSELVKLIWIARVARPGALCDASVSAQTSEATGETIVNPIDVEESDDANVAKLIDASSYSHMPRFVDFNRKSPNDANSVNLLKKIKMSTKRKPVLRSTMYCICQERLRN